MSTQAQPRSRFRLSLGTSATAMASLAALLMFVNAARAFADPAGFASYLGLPLADARDAGLVLIYASRTLFIGVAVAGIVMLRQWRLLTLLALVAAGMALGDAALASGAGAPTGTIARHIGIALYLTVTALLMRLRRD